MNRVLILTILIATSCTTYTEFENVDNNQTDTNFSHFPIRQDHGRDSLEVTNIKVDQGLNEINSYSITKLDTGEMIKFRSTFDITDVGGNSFIVLSGNRYFDSGITYLIFPKYSRILLIDKKDLSIVFDNNVNVVVSNAKRSGNYIYFWYGKTGESKLGRVLIE